MDNVRWLCCARKDSIQALVNDWLWEAGRLWRSLSPKFPYALLQDFKPGARGRDLMERGHRGSQDSAPVPGLTESWTCAISSAMWERESRLPLPARPQALAVRKTGRAGHDLSLAVYRGAAGVPIIKPQRGRELLFFTRFCLRWFSALPGSIHFWTSFFITTPFFGSYPVTPERAVPVWLFLRWSAVFSKIAWREPTRSEKC